MATTAAGTVAATLLVLEYRGVGPVLEFLRAFRSDVAVVGGEIRAGGPFQYPTIAAMHLEIAFALTLGLLPLAFDAGRRVLVVLVVGALLLLAEAITLTFTRAGLLVMVSSLLIVGGLRYRSYGIDRTVKAVAAIALIITVQLFTSRSLELLWLRWTTEGQGTWYRARVVAPRELTIPTGDTITVPVTLTNTGGTTWSSTAVPSFRFSYHWLLPDEDRVVSWEGLRTDFPTAVPPGGSVTLQARVEAPRQPGEYRVLWDIEQEHRLWFSTEPDAAMAISRATVAGPAFGPLGPIPTVPFPRTTVRPQRLVLWRAAVQMVRDHPLLGVGPDNFRLLYGEYAGVVGADPRIHSNNMYLEILAGAGVIGGLAFFWLAWRALICFTAAARRAVEPLGAMGAGVAAAGAAIALHRTLDSFLSFTPTYVMIALALGLGAAYDTLSNAHAHRV